MEKNFFIQTLITRYHFGDPSLHENMTYITAGRVDSNESDCQMMSFTKCCFQDTQNMKTFLNNPQNTRFAIMKLLG